MITTSQGEEFAVLPSLLTAMEGYVQTTLLFAIMTVSWHIHIPSLVHALRSNEELSLFKF